ncbi:MAG: hypothetical protein ACK41D_11725 [Rubricoccaceae bacterium]
MIRSRRALPALLALALAPLALLTAPLAAGCGGPPSERVPLRLERSNPERVLRALLGGYVADEGGDPFEAGLVAREGGGFALDPAHLDARFHEALRAADADADGALDQDEFDAFVGATYARARRLPPTLDALRAEAPFADDPAWFVVDVTGAMTEARRRVYVPLAALRGALVAAAAPGGALVYAPGTWIVGEHRLGGALVETTAKRRRADGFWDFAVYDASGRLAPSTATAPRPLASPVQCTGCHLGRRLFEPEKSFPAAAPDGPYGEQAYHVPDAWRSGAITAHFQEHARRPDGVLGLYATLYTGRLAAARAAGTLPPDDAAFLARVLPDLP